MAFDEELANRVRHAIPDDAPVSERTMFGGLAFLVNGHMFCGIIHEALMLRLGPDGAQRASPTLTCVPWTSPAAP